MRDPERIDRIVERLRILWHKMPDQRLGQLLMNIHRYGYDDDKVSIWQIEDDVWETSIALISEFGFQ